MARPGKRIRELRKLAGIVTRNYAPHYTLEEIDALAHSEARRGQDNRHKLRPCEHLPPQVEALPAPLPRQLVVGPWQLPAEPTSSPRSIEPIPRPPPLPAPSPSWGTGRSSAQPLERNSP